MNSPILPVFPARHWFSAPKGFAESRPGASRSGSQLLVLTLCVWLSSFLLSTVRDLAAPPPMFIEVTLVRLAFAGIGCALCYPLHIVQTALTARTFPTRIFISLPAIAILAVVYTESTLAVQGWFGSPSPSSALRFYNTVYWGIWFLTWFSLHLALTYSHEAIKQAERAREADRHTHDAQLRALRYQIDPHFLFNALNSVSSLIVTRRNDEAEAMTGRLARFFRVTSSLDPHASITLAEEMQLQRLYLEIEQVRFPDLEVDIAVTSEAGEVHVPGLILQPIIENAVTHGVSGRPGPALITVAATTHGGSLRIEVVNDLSDKAGEGGAGTGLANVRDRLRATYGALASLAAQRSGEACFHVVIEIPITSPL